MSAALFGTLQAEARQQIERVAQLRPSVSSRQASSTQAVTRLQVVVRTANPDLLAEKLILGAVCVDKVLEPIPGVDFRPGDLILDYDTDRIPILPAADSQWSPAEHVRWSAQWIAQKVYYGRVLHILRGDRMLAVTLPEVLYGP